MAFHLACPLTCRKICACPFGDSNHFLQKLNSSFPNLDFSNLNFGGNSLVDVLVPCLPKDVKKIKQKHAGRLDTGGEDVPPAHRRGSAHRKLSVAAISVAEAAKKVARADPAAGNDLETDGSLKRSNKAVAVREENAKEGSQDVQNGEDLENVERVVCGFCSAGEVEGREGERRMLSCHSCARKYHRNCVKKWADFRDLFNWSAWVCPSCRSCEVCRRTGEADKLTFCKRCDAALHVYCQQPPLKHVPKGPYLCPKHTKCHSCSSNVPGSGVSSRWFMSYTNCDACGRLFVKDKYCPVCLKVYRDSEMTPMVCCDACEHWVHCKCDGISDEKFHQFQHDDNLRYKCAACRGDCHKVTGIDDAVRELWKRKDESEADQRAKLYAAARLPSAEEMAKLCPSSDDENPPASASPAVPSRVGDRSKKRKKDVVLLASVKENVRKKMIIQRRSAVKSEKSSAAGQRTPNNAFQSSKHFKGNDITPIWFHNEGNETLMGDSEGFLHRDQQAKLLAQSSDRERGRKSKSWFESDSNSNLVEVELLNQDDLQYPLKMNGLRGYDRRILKSISKVL